MDSKETAKKYLSACRRGDAESAYALTTKTWRVIETLADFAGRVPFGENERAHGFRVLEVTSVCHDVTFYLSRKQWRVRLVKETGVRQTGATGVWGVNPISLRREI